MLIYLYLDKSCLNHSISHFHVLITFLIKILDYDDIEHQKYQYWYNYFQQLILLSCSSSQKRISKSGHAQCDHFQQFYTRCNVKVDFPIIDRGPLLQILFASFILIHKKHMCCSAMLSKDLFSHLTDTKT